MDQWWIAWATIYKMLSVIKHNIEDFSISLILSFSQKNIKVRLLTSLVENYAQKNGAKIGYDSFD